LLHGVGAIWRAWSPVLPYLEPHHDVIVPTLLGHGGSAPLDAGVAPSIQALTDGVERHLDALGLDEVHIAGNSLGGWIGIELARRNRARSLVLFSPAGAWHSQRGIEMRANAIRWSVCASGLIPISPERLATNRIARWAVLGAQVAHPDRVPPELLAAYLRAGALSPAVAPLLRVLPQRPVDPLPPERSYPVRLVWGTRDRVIPYPGYGSAMLARLPGAELIHVPDVGHVPMTDDPARIGEMILEVTSAVDGLRAPA
jgi:pimeloyl-ACP methyl ester carboxylesterase